MNDLPFPKRFPWLPAMAILAFSGALFLCNWLVWTPMQRYYLGSYLRCALLGTDPAAWVFFLPVAIFWGSAIFGNELEVGSHYGSKDRKSVV